MPRGFMRFVFIFCALVGGLWLVLVLLSAPREIKTEIVIEAPIGTVWKELVDFDNYPAWNPFITYISGPVVAGSRLEVHVQPPGGSPMTFRPVLEEAKETQRLQWTGVLFIPGLFDGTHRFEMEFYDMGKVKFTQTESFSGLLVGPLTDSMLARTEQGFKEMNEALKKRCERR